jgi:hypothetical protein
MADQYSHIDDVSKRASQEESGNNLSDGGKLVRGTARELIHNNVSLLLDVMMKLLKQSA